MKHLMRVLVGLFILTMVFGPIVAIAMAPATMLVPVLVISALVLAYWIGADYYD